MFNLFFRHGISELRRPISAKFCTVVCTGLSFIMPVQNFVGALPPQKKIGPKTCKILLDFGRLHSSTANISETDEDIQNRTSTWSTAIPSEFGEKSLVNFGPLTTEI